MPEYEIKRWDVSNSPVNIDWVKESLKKKKWAFASDYIRLYALYHEGGIYLDTDVFVKKDFSMLLTTDFFTGIEYNEDKFFATGSDKLLNRQKKKGVGIEQRIYYSGFKRSVCCNWLSKEKSVD